VNDWPTQKLASPTATQERKNALETEHHWSKARHRRGGCGREQPWLGAQPDRDGVSSGRGNRHGRWARV